MLSNINLMNVAVNFIPCGSNIIKVNESGLSSGMRSGEQSKFILVEYYYNDIPYTMILLNNGCGWEIENVLDRI